MSVCCACAGRRAAGTAASSAFTPSTTHCGERHPDRLERLYQPFWFDRQREFRPGESPIFSAPVFENGGELRARFSAHQINGGYALRGEPIDSEGEAAIAAMLDIFEEDDLSVDFDLEPGQIQFVTTGRSATAAPPSSITPNPTASAISFACGCATTAAAPTPAEVCASP